MAGKKDEQAAEKQVQAAVDEETEQGFRGTQVDPTPNENYTVKGVTAGKPTPETDKKQAEKARAARADVETDA